MPNSDFLVIGGGVIGLNIARELRQRHPDADVTLIEKESGCGQHASGRNSGVLHAGFYYTPDSLKARFTRDGNRLLTDYCERKGIPINKCGKLVVARDADDLPFLDELLARGRKNGVELYDIDEVEARSIEPRVITHQRAIFSPNTASVNPADVMRAMQADAEREGVRIHLGVRYLQQKGRSVRTSAGDYQAGYVVNAAGLYADKIAKDFGFSERYQILPFKGLYLYSDEPPGSVRTNIYPVPDLRNPFLGVHYTVTVDGRVKIGPTAIPAFWREQYQGYGRFSLPEFADIARLQLGLFTQSSFDFKRLAMEEMRKYSRSRMVSLAAGLLRDVDQRHYLRWGKPGIRAQLLDVRSRKLEMDFVLEGDDRSMHVLNAVSPAFTCSIPFSRHVCDRIEAAVH
ncbi:MAG: L-2-hydroxyglutarate oxidase [Pseudomonadota bacterium]|uniref:L-2-hydroxyglutarate oxidase n=1 Tax=Thermithiobacillus tepidarius TaxID=929 RepID=UPI00040AECC8|nr:L-2-hydroxyglutarate oxidase [Thermithiobacillus tepidarius]